MRYALNPALAKRIMAIVSAVVIALGFVIALSGCDNGDEQAIRDGIGEQLDLFKDPTEENLADVIQTIDPAQLEKLEAYNIDTYEFLRHALRGFDYAVGKIRIDGDKAYAQVALTNIDVQAAIDEAMARMENDASVAQRAAAIRDSEGQNAMMAYAFSIFYECMDAQTKLKTTDIELNLTKTENTWRVDDASMRALISGVYGGLPNVQ